MEGFIADLVSDWEGRFRDTIERHRDQLDPILRLELVLNSTGSIPASTEGSLRAWATIDPIVRRAQRRIDAAGEEFFVELLSELDLDSVQRDEAFHHAVALVAGLQIAGGSMTQTEYFDCWASWVRGSLGQSAVLVDTPTGPQIKLA